MGLKNRVLSAFCVVGIMLIGLVLPVLAGATALPLPPRPTAEPPVVAVVEKEPSPTRITLSLDLTSETLTVDPQTLWTVVQWQDALGDWHDVDGWTGPLDAFDATHGEKSWGVLRRNFGQSPFRWLVYAKQGGMLVAATGTFTLPVSSGKTLIVQAVPVAK